MSLFDEAAMYGADTTAVQAGGESFLNSAWNAATWGVGAAAISGFGSIYNTFASGANALGANLSEIDTYKALESMDQNWAEYYKSNQNAIDIGGFIGASLVPGTLAVKALNAARAGAAGNAVARALGFARTRQVASLDAALGELATEGGSVFTRINKNKLAAMAWGAADQTLTAAAFEVGVAATMKESPLFADDSWWDIGKNVMIGAAFGGVIGGGIDALILNRDFRNAIKSLDAKTRKYDYMPNFDDIGLATGDRAYGIADALSKLPQEVVAGDQFIPLSFHLAQGKVSKILDASQPLASAINQTQRTALESFETALRDLAGKEAPDVADVFARKMLADLKTQIESGVRPELIRDNVGSQLWELKKLSPAIENPSVTADQLWYFNRKISAGDLEQVKTLDDWEALIHRSTPYESNVYNKPYVFIGTAEDRERVFSKIAKISKDPEAEFKNLNDAWKAGYELAFDQNGAMHVHPNSNHWRRVEDPVYSPRRYYNTRTGAVTEDAVLTAADVQPAGKALSFEANAVVGHTKDGTKMRWDMRTFSPDKDVKWFTARHAWASQLADGDLPRIIDSRDFSLLDRLSRINDFSVLENIKIVNGDNVLGQANQIDLKSLIRSSKLSEAQQRLADAWLVGNTLDTRELSHILNVEPQWLEQSIVTRFRDSLSGTLEVAGKQIDLAEGLSADLARYATRETVLAEYARPQQFSELGAVTPKMSWLEKRNVIMDGVSVHGGAFATGEVAWGYRVQEAIQRTRNASSAVLGTEKVSQLMELSQDAAKLANSTGTGSSSFGAANADYGDVLGIWSQQTGKLTHLWKQEAVNDAVDRMTSVSNGIRNNPAAAAELGIVTNLLRGSDLRYVWSQKNPGTLIAKELAKVELDDVKFAATLEQLAEAGSNPVLQIKNKEVAEFLMQHSKLNAERLQKRSVLNTARGFTSNKDPEVVYAPPIDTTYFRHFAFVRPKAGKAFSTSEVSMIFGRDAAELNKRIASIDPQNFDVIMKDGTENYFKAKGLYDFDLTINEPRINSELRRSGALSNFHPEVRAENLVEDYLRWHQNQASRLVSDAVETHYAQQIAELRHLGERYKSAATSQFSGNLRSGKFSAIDPYDDYVKTALDISKRSEWTFLHQANEFVDALGTRAYQAAQAVFGDAQKGLVKWQEANAIAESYGIKGPYQGAEDFFTANVPRDRNLIKEYVSKANMLLANFVLRFDFANSMLNVISTPLMLGTELASIKTLVAKDPELAGKLAELTSIKVPGEAAAVPGMGKLLGNAVKNFFGADKDALIMRYRQNGDIRDTVSQYHSMMDSLALRADFKQFSDGVNAAFEKVSNLTGNNWAEQFTRFVSADVMRQLTDPLVDAGKLSLREQNAYISTFTNRVQGNYITSQRPVVFQGVLGSAVSLFQTYSFNLLQQLLRHVENKDTRAIRTMIGLQTGLFGLNGTPMFEAVNTHLIGNSSLNDGHFDAYSLAPQMLGKELGDWLMYGTASAFPAWGDKAPALYTRGDINPRHISIIPINPVDVPAIDASIRVVKNLMDVGSKLISGANVSQTLLQGLEHNGVNRPLAGFAQVLAGQSTTSKGSLISASNDFNMIASASRVIGAKPMDEALALNAMYRMNAYKAADRDRMEFLGERVKSYLGRGQFPPDDVIDQFMKDYAAAGGRLENFNATMQRWFKDANTSTVEKMRAKLKSSYGQRLNEIMGGVPLEGWEQQAGDSEQLIPD